MKVMSFLFLFLLSSISFAGEDTVKCYSTPALNNPEIEKLFSMIKNDVLGIVPRFCRSNGPEQIGDNEQGSKDLAEFVEALKKSSSDGKDVFEIASSDSSKMEAMIFSAVKMLVLKKMWNQTKEDDQYSLLISEECSGVGLNRFEMHKMPQKIINAEVAESKLAYKKTLKTCEAKNLKQLTPFITKDILAESLLSLKTSFPKSFPEIVTTYCDVLSVSDEFALKNDEYKDYLSAERNISTVDEFSSWLRNIYVDGFVSKDGMSLSRQEEFKLKQQRLKKEFENPSYQKISENEVRVSKNDVVYKNSQGRFYMRYEDVDGIIKKGLQSQKDSLEYSVKENFEIIQKKLKDIYEVKASTDLPGFPGVKIVKGDDGIYRYEISPDEKEKVQTLIKNYKSNQDEITELLIRNPANQRELKKKYEDEIAIKDLEDPKVVLSVIKDKDGFYRPNSLAKLSNDGKTIAGKLIEKLSADSSVDFIPTIGESGFIQSADPDLPGDYSYLKGKIALKELEIKSVNSSSRVESFGNNSGLNTGLERAVWRTMTRNYQQKNLDKDGLSSLDKDSTKDVREYTGVAYKELNACLRKSNCSSSQNKKVKRIIEILNQMKKENSKTEYQIVFRGAASLTPEMKQELKKNSKGYVMDKAFMSTSADSLVATQFQTGALFILKVKSCASIAKFSQVVGEDEFLCPPGMKFNVKQKETASPTGLSVYILEEAGN